LAPDDALVIGGEIEVDDPHAIVLPDGGWVGWRLSESALRNVIEALAAFSPEPGLNQGMIAGLPAKAWIAGDNSMVIVPAAFGAELEERLR
jgi:hypothetical protein